MSEKGKGLAQETIQPKHPISQRKPRVLLAATGSVSATRFPSLCRYFLEWAEVKAVVTKSSLEFIDRSEIPDGIRLYTDAVEWPCWKGINGSALQLDLWTWADLMVIAPLTANTLAKISAGHCDNLLTCIVRGWDYRKPLYIAPSMNDSMWNNTITEQHLANTSHLGMSLIMPSTRKLPSGELVVALMAEPADLYNAVRCYHGPFPRNPR